MGGGLHLHLAIEGWLYVAAVIDPFSRRVVGWAMKTEMTAPLVADALIMAIRRGGKPDSRLHHPDGGSQYTDGEFQRPMADHGITCSMSRAGNVWGKAPMEGFFSLLKAEWTTRKVHRARDDAGADVLDYIEHSTTVGAGTRSWALSAGSSSRNELNQLNLVSAEPAAGH
ncbi:hypothetical protein GCM10028812_08770 [Ancylobacter sonchi]